MIRTPQKAIFDTCFVMAMGIAPTYDFLPDAEAQYPFIHIGSASNIDIENNDLIGEVSQTINIWGTREHRSDIDSMLVKLHDKLRQARIAFDYSINLIGFRSMVIDDMSTGSPLLHLVIETTYNYTRR